MENRGNTHIPEICFTMFQQFLQGEFMFVIVSIKSLLYLSLAFLTRLVTSFMIFLYLFQCMRLLKYFAFLWILFFFLIMLRIFQDNHLGPPVRIVTILLVIEDSAALKIALIISFVINSISSVRKSESQFTLNKLCLSFS